MNGPDVMRKFRRSRVEWLLAGMALAKSGDRDKILAEIDSRDLQSSIVRYLLDALRDSDTHITKGCLQEIGIEPRQDACTSVMDKIKKYGSEERARSIVRTVMETDNLKVTLQSALCEIND